MTVDSAVGDALLQLDRSIDDAASQGDFATLQRVLADDFVYTHSTGAVEPRDEWIQGLQRLVGQRQRVAHPATAETHGDLAAVMGDLDIVWVGERPTARNRYVRLYRLIEGEWQAIAQRTVPAPDRGS